MLLQQEIQQRIVNIKQTVPEHVILEAAAKTRSVDEALAVIDGGISVLGYNYVQEAESIQSQINKNVKWHMIGHLQSNKVKKAVQIFDMIETVDSIKLAELINKECKKINKVMDVLIEVNSGRETRKAGVAPDDAERLIRSIHELPNIRIKGLMTMGPWVENAEELRPYFRQTKEIFDHLTALNIPNVEMRYLSMGMSGSYRVAIEEGATMVRLGTILFGPRSYS
jgi:pyridoxal phosphate enzyme (YggS family)